MYAGEIVESGPTSELISRPAHPYTKALLEALPEHAKPKQPIPLIQGALPNFLHRRKGCIFAPRCVQKTSRCDQRLLKTQTGEREVSCWNTDRIDAA